MNSWTEEEVKRALLDTIAGTESPGYNVMYGGKRFSSFDDHPRIGQRILSGPNKGRTSSAAGRYQFLKGTWDEMANKLGLKDFSPKSQDTAATALAEQAYGPNIWKDLMSGDPAKINRVGQKLSGTWTSLPRGIEQNSRYGKRSFYDEFTKNTVNPTVTAQNPTPGQIEPGPMAEAFTQMNNTVSPGPPPGLVNERNQFAGLFGQSRHGSGRQLINPEIDNPRGFAAGNLMNNAMAQMQGPPRMPGPPEAPQGMPQGKPPGRPMPQGMNQMVHNPKPVMPDVRLAGKQPWSTTWGDPFADLRNAPGFNIQQAQAMMPKMPSLGGLFSGGGGGFGSTLDMFDLPI